MANLELVITAGADSKEWLAKLEKQIDRLERLRGAKDEPAPAVESDDAEDEDEDEAPKAKAKSKPKKVAEAFDDDEDEPAEDDGEDEAGEEDEDEAPTAKAKSKPKKLTPDDCNDAAKALAKAIGGKPGRDAVLKLMKKQFRTVSVSELKPEQYADFIAAMAEAVEEHEE